MLWYAKCRAHIGHYSKFKRKLPTPSTNINIDRITIRIISIMVENEDEFLELVKDSFDRITNDISFAKKWCQKFFSRDDCSSMIYP